MKKQILRITFRIKGADLKSQRAVSRFKLFYRCLQLCQTVNSLPTKQNFFQLLSKLTKALISLQRDNLFLSNNNKN